MANRRAVKKIRSLVPSRKALNNIDVIRRQVDDIDKRFGYQLDLLAKRQLEINHNQLRLLDEIKKRVDGSGVILLNQSEMLTKIFCGLKIYLDPRDIAVAPHVALDGIWEHRVTSAWLSVIGPNNIIFDIGANFGYYGLLAAQKTDKKKSKVVFIEANPHLLHYIKKSLNVNWLNEQSVVENFALADKKGELKLHILKDYIGSSSVKENRDVNRYMHGKMELQIAETIKVKAVTLDDYCAEHKITNVDLIKMDIEGVEDKAYQGMRQIVKSSRKVTLFVEFTKSAYDKPEAFYNQMLNDFGHVYIIDQAGFIKTPASSDYSTVIGDTDDWVMPIFSKRSDLANG